MDIKELNEIAAENAKLSRERRLRATGEIMNNKEMLFNQIGFAAGVKWAEQNQHRLNAAKK